MPVISVVVPVCNEEANLDELCAELARNLDGCCAAWEIIMVDDGSTDATWQVIERLHGADKRVKGLRLVRNMGHQFALLAGLRHAKGDAVISMDGDLQHPPSLVPELVDRWRQGYKLVQARRAACSSTPVWKSASSKWFYRFFSLLSGVELCEGLSDFRLLDRSALEVALQFGETGLFWRGIVQVTGVSSTLVDYVPRPRKHGRTKYTLLRMCNLAWTGITSFSLVPLRLAVILGGAVSLLAFAELLYVLYVRLFTESAVPGWASALSVVSFLFGVLFVLLGIVGEYVGRILVEVRRRPRYILAETAGIRPMADSR